MNKKILVNLANIFQWLATGLLIFSVILLVITAFNPVKKFQILRVMSGSMEPEIHTGSVVFSIKTDPKTLNVGDIINYSSKDPNVSVTHRLVEIATKNNQTVFRTKGDANQGSDAEEIYDSAIKGKVIFSIPYLGYISVWMKTPLGFILTVIIPAILIIGSEIFNIKKAIEEEVKKKYENKQ